ncbi:hypothetical protein V2J09_008457 [Rumex salicifolius]
MAIESPERVVENLRKQLSVAVRSVQWSYAVFWSLSTTKQGVLEWSDGYYNGDVKTRKTVPTAEVYADKLGLRRSEQLRELYESLLVEESELGNTNTRAAATLCPEDLSDLEWYYLVCMSFTFKVGQSLPGKAFANGQSVWLCNAHEADSKLFTRSLLAKTVICFPHMGGVIELGVTDLISEDPKLIQHIKTSLLEFAKPVCTEKSSSEHENADYDKDQTSLKIPEINQEMVEPEEAFVNLYPATEGIKLHENVVNEMRRTIEDDCSIECCENNQQREDSFMLEANGNGNDIVANSPVQSWHLVDDDDYDDDDLSRCIQDSFNSSGCISQGLISSKDKYMNNCLHLEKMQDCNDTKFSSLDLGNNNEDEDLHYKRTVAAILQVQSSHFLVKGQSVCSYGNRLSSFVPWKKAFVTSRHSSQLPQKALKKILCMVPLMIARSPLDHPNEDGKEPKSREENSKYLVLRSLVPSINKMLIMLLTKLTSPSKMQVDKISILNDTVDYLKELEARVEELESCINQSECEVKARRKYVDVAEVEQTSDNYHTKSRSDPKKLWANKRKACDIDENDPELEQGKTVPLDNKAPFDMNVKVREQEVIIEMRCPWREYLLLDIMDAVNSLCLDAHTVQSSTDDGVLILTLKSKFRGAAFASAGMIKQALRKMVGIC